MIDTQKWIKQLWALKNKIKFAEQKAIKQN